MYKYQYVLKVVMLNVNKNSVDMSNVNNDCVHRVTCADPDLNSGLSINF